VGVPLLPLTVIVTDRDWAVVMLEGVGVTVTVGVVFVGGGGVIVEPPPPPQALRARLIAAANRSAANPANRFIFISPGITGRPVTALVLDFRACRLREYPWT
jgi:hypothetical protein